ncbi:hypothetical protein [Paraburkholderia tuberum]|uniref:Uncharacterized protein n=1 Tax=Paraburkholderia tuberum TaxID=157910 RepID=A0A1H1GUX2_9BURK|nr:hypothetical protein [Paraburkholderia tuberum]SDR16941.1 hypothetical protein SAMN05445850_3098 [Paraburkholderia tuberum]
MRCHFEILHAPLDSLTVAECGALALTEAMQLVRVAANDIRLNWWMSRRDMSFRVGYFAGVRSAALAALRYGDDGYDELRELAGRYASEVEFLSWPYLRCVA